MKKSQNLTPDGSIDGHDDLKNFAYVFFEVAQRLEVQIFKILWDIGACTPCAGCPSKKKAGFSKKSHNFFDKNPFSTNKHSKSMQNHDCDSLKKTVLKNLF